MKSLLLLLATSLLSFTLQAQALPELRQYTNGGKITAEITIVSATRHFTSYGKCPLRSTGAKLVGTYQQAFSDRNQFMGDKDQTGIEIDLRSGVVTIILIRWGGGHETYTTQIQPNGKLLASTNTDTAVLVSLDVVRGQAID